MEKRRIALIAGSKTDYWQMIDGLEFLIKMRNENKIELFKVNPASQHRRPLTVQSILFEYSKMPKDKKPHFIITSAGWANHLSGCCDAFLRYTLGDDSIVVIAVAMKDPENEAHTLAAITSTSEVPGKQVVFTDENGFPLAGPDGYLWAAKYAALTNMIPTVIAKEPPEFDPLDATEAVRIGKLQLAKRLNEGKPIH